MDYQSHDAVLAVMLQLDADALQDTTPVMLVLTGRHVRVRGMYLSWTTPVIVDCGQYIARKLLQCTQSRRCGSMLCRSVLESVRPSLNPSDKDPARNSIGTAKNHGRPSTSLTMSRLKE